MGRAATGLGCRLGPELLVLSHYSARMSHSLRPLHPLHNPQYNQCGSRPRVTPSPKVDNSPMRLLLDFFPIALFVVAYKLGDIYAATAVLMAATALQTALIYKIDGKVATVQKATLGLIVVFGTLTLVLHDQRFIQWKPTVLYVALALLLAVALLVFKRYLLHLMLGTQLKLPTAVWHKLALMWAAYFLAMGVLNAVVAVYFTLDQWVEFKLWGYIFPVLFILGQGLYIAKYLRDEDPQEVKQDQP
jgi:intracellular septation protein